jgi:3,4-dihydroxy 2-butanone 4-phosphate synthase/GTP cyclohydrolase II
MTVRSEPASGANSTVRSGVKQAIADIAAGRPVVVVDDADRENEGDLIFAAQFATPELVAFMMTECRGLICVPMAAPDLDRLQLGQMVEHNTEHLGTAFTVSVDASQGISTGISAADRAHTIRLLADPVTHEADLVRPGHVFPLRAKDGGVIERHGHTEAAIELTRLAGLRAAAAICEIANADGSMARRPDLEQFAEKHDLTLITIAELIAYLRPVERVVEARLPTTQGVFRAIGYTGDHVALVYGDLGDGADVLVRVHSECLTGDVFGSLRCDCGPQLRAALATVAAAGRGAVIYLRGHEGRGIGLLHKLRAYRLQEDGSDTVEANLALGLPADDRDYGAGAAILADLGITAVRLLTNNPAKQSGLQEYGVRVTERVPMPVHATEENIAYLTTKRDRMGHDLPDLPELEPASGA